MKKLFITTILALSFLLSFATPQAGDLLIYKGDTIVVYTPILDSVIQNSSMRDSFYKKNKELLNISTACWRGYHALMEVRNDSIFLLKIYGANRQEMDITLLFGKDKDIFLDWCTGTLTNPRNQLIYVHDGWGGYYEYETDLIFEKGILKDVKEYHNTIKTTIYTEGDTLKNFIKSNINYNNVKPTNRQIRVIAKISDIDENGKITDVSVLRGYNDEYDREAIRVVKSIPQWQVIIRRGKKVHNYWTISVIFEAKD